jgi:phosphate-selective porin OprO/OprP
VTALGALFDNRVQYWSAVTNTAKATYYDLNRYVNYNGQVDFTPFTNTEGILKGLGGGVGFLAGIQKYALNQGNAIGFTNNGEATTNFAWVTMQGIPFAQYNNNVRANGLETQVMPHLYWYGRFSFLGEYVISSRELTDGNTTGRSTQRGYYINLSYYLTGERDFAGNGFQGYSTVVPLRPFAPQRGEWGPGAWQLAAQFSELNVGRGDFNRGFIDNTKWTNRLDSFVIGMNWWPNKYTRLTADYVWTGFNNPIPVNGPAPISSFNTVWLRFAMFF